MLVGLIWKIPKQPTVSRFYLKKKQKKQKSLTPFSLILCFLCFGPKDIAFNSSQLSGQLSDYQSHMGPLVSVCFAFVSSILFLELPAFPRSSPHGQIFLCCRSVNVLALRIYIAAYISSTCQTRPAHVNTRHSNSFH